MVRRLPKPPPVRSSDRRATGGHDGSPRLLTNAQYADKRRKRADMNEKLRQMTVAERERRR